MSLRQDIAAKIGLALEEITVANGYKTDLGNTVIYYYGQVDQGVEHLTYQDSDEDYTEINRVRQCELSLDIQAVRYGFNYGQLVNEAVEDILKAVLKDKSLGLQNVYIAPVNSTVDVDVTGRDFIVVQMKFRAKYITSK